MASMSLLILVCQISCDSYFIFLLIGLMKRLINLTTRRNRFPITPRGRRERSLSPLWERIAGRLRSSNLRMRTCELHPIFFTSSLFLVSPFPQCRDLSTFYQQKEVSPLCGKEALDNSGCWIWGRGRAVCCIHFSFLIAFLRVSASTVLISLRLLLLQHLL